MHRAGRVGALMLFPFALGCIELSLRAQGDREGDVDPGRQRHLATSPCSPRGRWRGRRTGGLVLELHDLTTIWIERLLAHARTPGHTMEPSGGGELT